MTAALPRLADLELVYTGKVRALYALDATRYLMVASDRLSAFDVILPEPIPGKGEILTELSAFWLRTFEELVPNQLTGQRVAEVLAEPDASALAHRAMVVKRLKPLPIEAIVRGYLAGSGWAEYRASGTLNGQPLPAGLVEAQRLPEPLFTPSSKAPLGEHDAPLSRAEGEALLGAERYAEVERVSLQLFSAASALAASRGLILADTKFEFGLDEHGRLTLMDEVLTPDSSRFWDAEHYRPGSTPPSFDKQYVRDWLKASGWQAGQPLPALPAEVVAGTLQRYREALARLSVAVA